MMIGEYILQHLYICAFSLNHNREQHRGPPDKTEYIQLVQIKLSWWVWTLYAGSNGSQIEENI